MSKRRLPPQREVPLVRKDGFHLPVFRRRAMLYDDGFHLFHAVQDLGAEHLKWLDLKALARQIAPAATWGNMLDAANNYIETAPWLWFFPGTMILLTVLGINYVGDGLRDAMDPYSSKHL